MSILSQIKQGNSNLPHRILLSGIEGIGKSTFASKAPTPLFICAEDGLTGLDHVPRYVPANLDALNTFLDGLSIDCGQFKTLVIDTADWLERLIASGVCARDQKKDIEDYGYGKGYVVLETELVKLLQKLDALRHSKKLGIIILSHVQIKPFNDPRGQSWDRFEMKGHKKFTGILREWPDACLFATYEVFQTKGDGSKIKTLGGERVIYTAWNAAWDAKNRLNLPETLPLDYDAFEAAIKDNSTAAMVETIKKLMSTATFAEGEKPKWEKWVTTITTQTADKLKSTIQKLTEKQPK